MWPSGCVPHLLKGEQGPYCFLLCDLQKSKKIGREAGEWKEEAENELKQEVGRRSLQTTAFFQALAEKGARRSKSEVGLNDVRVDEN